MAGPVSIRTSFTSTDPFSVVAAQTETAKLVTSVTNETRQAIRDVITKSIQDGVTPKDTAKLLRDVVGLNSQQSMAVYNLWQKLDKQGASNIVKDKATAAYGEKLLRYRTETIARTEIMRAQNLGQRAAWNDAVAKGHIGAQSSKVWIVALDDRLCPLCEGQSGEVVPLDGVFSGGVSEPPLHPRCRCTVGLVPSAVPAHFAPVPSQFVAGPVETGTRKAQALRTAKARAVARAEAKAAQKAANAAARAEALALKAEAEATAAKLAAETAEAQKIAALMEQLKAAEIKAAEIAAANKAAQEASLKAASDAFKAKQQAIIDEAKAIRDAKLAATRNLGSREWMDDMLSRGKVGAQAGSNPGGMYEDARGVKYYVKQYKDPRQAMSEAVSNRIYRELKLGGPESYAVQTSDGTWQFASRIVDNEGTVGNFGLTQNIAKKVLDGFSADVLTVNWDAVGTGLDNVVIAGKKIVRIDQGGTLMFRAQGGAKPSTVFSNINEWETLRTQNSYYKQVFEKAGIYSADELGAKAIKQIDAIEALRAKHGGWEKFVRKSLVKSAKADPAFVKETAQLLEARTNLLLQKRAQLQSVLGAPVAPVRTSVGAWPIDDHTVRFVGNNYPRMVTDQFNNALNNLSRDVKAEIRLYTGSGSSSTNSRLWRDPRSLTAREAQMQKALESAKDTPPELVWRGIRRETVGVPGRPDLTNVNINSVKVGDLIQLNGFQSTSINPAFAHRWGSNQLPLLEIKPARGLYVDPISSNKGEQEFMLEHAARYRVVGVKTINLNQGYGTPIPRKIVQLEMF